MTKNERERARKHIYKQPGSANWFARFYLHGKQVRETTGTEDETEACRIVLARLDDAGVDRRGKGKFVGPEQKRIKVQELLDALKLDYKLRGKGTGPRLDANMKPLEEWFGHFKALDLTSADIDKFIDYALQHGRRKDSGKPARPASINRSLQLLGQAYKLGKKQRHLSHDLYIRRLSEVGNRREGFFSPMEFRSVSANLEPDLADYATFAWLSAWRPKEIRSLSWPDLDGDVIKLKPENAKIRKGRSVPLVGELAAVIERRRQRMSATTNLVFHRDGKPMGDFRKAWHTACKLAGVNRLFYDLRRSGVRDLIRAGTSQTVAMSISGHTTDAMFRRYDITSDTDQRAALEARQSYSTRAVEQEQAAQPVTERVQ
jgi:integrase